MFPGVLGRAGPLILVVRHDVSVEAEMLRAQKRDATKNVSVGFDVGVLLRRGLQMKTVSGGKFKKKCDR